MSLLSIIVVLLLEQWRPLHERGSVQAPLRRFADYLEEHFNAGERQHGVIAWLLAVLPILAIAWAIYGIAWHVHPLLALVVNVGVLYLTLGFRQASHHFTAIQRALKEGELDRAREVLGAWQGRSAAALSREDITRVAIEQALADSHRLVFGVLFWYLILPGPTGALLYRIAPFLASRWGRSGEPDLRHFGWFAHRAARVLDWLPARLTAIGFAVVGDFEDAVYCWRTQAAKWIDPSIGVVLASGAGAMGVRLGNPLPAPDGGLEERPELGLGDEADTEHLDSTVGLVWRTLALWLAMVLIVTMVRALS